MPVWAQGALLTACVAPPAYTASKKAVTAFRYSSLYIFHPILSFISYIIENLKRANEYIYPTKYKEAIAKESESYIEERPILQQYGNSEEHLSYLAEQKRLNKKFRKYLNA